MFVVSASTLATDTTIEFCEDDKKCDKKNCKHKKKACTKTDKATAKKCCAGKAGAKTCSKKKKETTEKK